jgi:hypothetical protein
MKEHLDKTIGFLKRVYERGREIQLEQEAREQARKAEARAARRAAWRRRRESFKAGVGKAETLADWGAVFYFVCRWLWRAACFLLWLVLTNMLHQTGHATGATLVGWSMLMMAVYAFALSSGSSSEPSSSRSCASSGASFSSTAAGRKRTRTSCKR